MSYHFKQLQSSDATPLKQLLLVFGKAFEDIATYQGAIPSDDYLDRLLAKPHFIAVVAMDGDMVVGGLTSYELDKPEQERREVYIYDLAILEEHRRKGLATGLIKTLNSIAVERNAYAVYVQADTVDLPAIALYESLGKKESGYHFDLLAN